MPDRHRGRNLTNSHGSAPPPSSLPTITPSSAADIFTPAPAQTVPTPTTVAPGGSQTEPRQLATPVSSLQHSSSTTNKKTSANSLNNSRKDTTVPIGRDRSPASFRSSRSALSCSSLPRGGVGGGGGGGGDGGDGNGAGGGETEPLLKEPWQAKVKAGTTIVGQFVRRRIPILSWLVCSPGYNWKNDLTQDMFAGVSM